MSSPSHAPITLSSPPIPLSASSTVQTLLTLFHHLASFPVTRHLNTSRRAAVACILRVAPDDADLASAKGPDSPTLSSFLRLPWVPCGTLEVVYCKRTVRRGDRWSGHVAWPGGKVNKGETDREGAERETREEMGLDLSDNERFLCLGELDHRSVPGTSGRPNWLGVVCFVYLQITPTTPPLHLELSELTHAFPVPLSHLLRLATMNDPTQDPSWTFLALDVGTVVESVGVRGWLGEGASKVAGEVLRKVVRKTVGDVGFPGILLPVTLHPVTFPTATLLNTSSSSGSSHAQTAPTHVSVRVISQAPLPPPVLWGLTLSMTCDMLDLCLKPEQVHPVPLMARMGPRYRGDVGWWIRTFHGGLPWETPVLRKPILGFGGPASASPEDASESTAETAYDELGSDARADGEGDERDASRTVGSAQPATSSSIPPRTPSTPRMPYPDALRLGVIAAATTRVAAAAAGVGIGAAVVGRALARARL
ncbi:hypothetical protein M427DRAFT_53875 [Gonapodya prolifera JEL478]|uniref:Nudix hydrolase domain-containing protein n=1 Tax=Gonapodya prolifera (strain JEL478) TaxID=1344416 RepID=A0A139AP48_GONPJ|nr:hypothetical protein M427DRAFT_53875 [Gonapodya prolifera JEL478]|eukprot:KXS18498.1 hypothetical protein M427DRAFT_53875 [Gonapodya prolifera JEL478]